MMSSEFLQIARQSQGVLSSLGKLHSESVDASLFSSMMKKPFQNLVWPEKVWIYSRCEGQLSLALQANRPA